MVELYKVWTGGGYRWRCVRSGLVVITRHVLIVDTGRRSGLVVNRDEVGTMSELMVDTDGKVQDLCYRDRGYRR